MLKITRREIFLSYFAQFLSMASGIIVLPFMLKYLHSNELGYYYIMLSIGSLVSLFDFGFTPQFSRSITYILSGARELTKEGINDIVEISETNINEKLFINMILTSKNVFNKIGLYAIITMLTFGLAYVYYITLGFNTIEYSLLIWLIFSFSIYFNIKFSYYSALLLGRGQILESKLVIIFSKISYLLFVIISFIFGYGLIGLVIANLIQPFVLRFFSKKYFFDSKIKKMLLKYSITKYEINELFKVVWFNSKKMGLVFLGSYAISKLSIFLSGLYFSLEEVASYGLMLQLFSILNAVSSTFFSINQPRFSSLRIKQKKNTLLEEFAFSMIVYYSIYFLGILSIFLLLPDILSVMDSNTQLPSNLILIIYSIVILLEGNHSNFATIITTRNDVPFVIPSLISGAFIAILSFISLEFFKQGILGLVLIQGIVQLLYSNWKWPKVVLYEFNISFMKFVKIGINVSKFNFVNIKWNQK